MIRIISFVMFCSLVVTSLAATAAASPPLTTPSPIMGTYSPGTPVTLTCTPGSGGACASTLYCLGISCTPATPYSGAIILETSTTLRFSSTDASAASEPVRTYEYTVNPDLTYRFERLWPAQPQPWYFFNPSGVAVDGSGNVFVADSGNHRIQKFDSNGTFIIQWGSLGSVSSQFNDPIGITVDSIGNVFVADTYNHRIQKFDNHGTFITQWGSNGNADGQFNGPSAVSVDSSGNVFVADTYNQRIQKFDNNGTFITQWGSGVGGGPLINPPGVAVDGNGNVYVIDPSYYRIQKFDNNGTYLTNWGAPGSGNGQFGIMSGIAIDGSGNVLVADSSNQRVQKFDGNGTYLAQWGSGGSGNGQFNFLSSIAVDSSGNIFVADRGNQRIQKFDTNGTYLAQLGANRSDNGQFDGPSGASIDSSGNIYIADSGNNRIQKFDGNGAFLAQYGSTPGMFNNPRDVAVDGYGNIFVADTANNRIQKFNADGDYLLQWGSAGSGDGEFNAPSGVAVDNSGNVLVVDSINRRIQKFDGSGTYLAQWGSYGSDDGQFINPSGVAVDSSGNLYVADSVNNRVQKFDGNGAYLTQWGALGSGNGQLSNPTGIRVGGNDNIFVVDSGNHRIQKFDASGAYLTQWGSFGTGGGQLNSPYGIVVDTSGNVFVTEQDNNRVQKFAPISPPVGLTISPSAYDFGNVATAVPTAAGFTLANPSAKAVAVSAITLDGDDGALFTLSPGDCGSLMPTLAPGASCTLQVTFTTTSTGNRNATLAISSNDPVNPLLTVPLTANGIIQSYALVLNLQGSGSGSVALTGGGSCSGSCAYFFDSGTTVQLTPSVTTGSSFGGWTGCDSVSGQVCTVMMGEVKTLTATFEVELPTGDQWEQTSTLDAGQILSLAIDASNPSVLFAASYTEGIPQIFKSSDAGQTWLSVTNGLSISSGILTLAKSAGSPAALYAGTAGSGLFKTVDSGAYWSSSGLDGHIVYAVAIDPADPSVMYASSFGGGVYKSTDSGSTWLESSTGISDRAILSLSIDPSNSAVIYAGSTSGAYKSIDGGLNWTKLNNGLPNTSIRSFAIDPADTGKIYVGTEYGGAFKSSDGGLSWLAIGSVIGSSFYAMAITGTTPSTLYAASYGNGIFRSTDDGSTWTTMNTGLSNLNIQSIAASSGTNPVLYAGTNGSGVFKLLHHVPIIAVTPTTMEFSITTAYSSSASQEVTIANSGQADLVVSGVTFTDADADQFTLSTGTCTSLTPTIPPGESCTMNVAFTPTSIGPKLATLAIVSNDPATPTMNISLSGTGYDPPPFGTVVINEGAAYASIAAVTLTLNAFDNSGVVAEMRFSNNNNSWSAWELYGTTKSWNLMALGGDGQKTVYVQFRDAVGSASGSFIDTITLDTTPPVTFITAKPASLYNGVAGSISFASEAGGTFQCQLDGGGFAPCTSPYQFTGLTDGNHTFSVLATDPAGNEEVTPATYTWTSDTTPPDTTITGQPANPATSAPFTFTFVSGDGGASFECRLDGGSYSACTSPHTIATLTDGNHSLQVRAKDSAGNYDPTPVGYTWTVAIPKNVKIGTSSYATLAAALAAAANGATLQLQSTIPLETVTYTGTATLTLSGGYDGSWNRLAGVSTAVGTVTIAGGTLIMDGITIQ